MDDLAAMKISSAGMAAQRMRMRVISENLANTHTVGPEGPYQRKDVVLQSVPLQNFTDEFEAALGAVENVEQASSVEIVEVAPDGADPVKRYMPGHPMADEQGYVSFPNISIIREMTDLIEANRSYEANLAASKATKDMIQNAMDLLT